MAPFLMALVKSGLGLVANATIEKGSGWLEEKTGIKVDTTKEPTPGELLACKQFMLEHEEELMKLQNERDHIGAELTKVLNAQVVENAKDINETMRAEAASEHWPTYMWRPAIGFAVAIAVVLSVLSVFAAYGASLLGHPEGLAQLPAVLAAVAGIIAVVSPILGIASWFRGKMQADPTIPTNNRG